MKLTIIVATRGRPNILIPVLMSLSDHATEKSTRILVCVDTDDLSTIEALGDFVYDDRIVVSIEPRERTRGLKYERALTEAPADLYLVAVDHTEIHTKGFDRKFLDAAALFPDGIGVVCTPMANASFPFLQAMTAKWVELVGYIQPPHFPFWFIDHWIDDVARMTGRYVMVDVVPDSSRRPGNTIGLRHLAFWTQYFDALVVERREQANRIIDALDEPEWRKTALRMTFPMVEYRSEWVNDQVRGMIPQIEGSRGGDKVTKQYLDVLNAAIGHYLELTEPLEKAA